MINYLILEAIPGPAGSYITERIIAESHLDALRQIGPGLVVEDEKVFRTQWSHSWDYRQEALRAFEERNHDVR